MDKRKFTVQKFKSLHKNLQLEKLSSENIDSDINRHATNITIRDKTNSFNDEQLPDIESSKLQPLNNRSIIKSTSLIKNKEKGFCTDKEDLLEENNLIVKHKLSKNRSLTPVENNQTLAKNITSQQSNNHLLKSGMSVTNRSLTATDLPVKKPVMQKRKISSSSTDSDSNLDSLSNKSKKRKKKHNEDMINKRIQYIGQNSNTCNYSRKEEELQDKSKEFCTMKQCNVNNENSPKESKQYPPFLVNFLQKCGIMLSPDGTCILSKFLHYIFYL